jgi:cell division septation protein DedD
VLIDSTDQESELNFDDLDREVGLGDMLSEKENVFLTLLKKLLFISIILIASVGVFLASFTIGKKMFLAENINNSSNYPIINPKESADIKKKTTVPQRIPVATKEKQITQEPLPKPVIIPQPIKKTIPILTPQKIESTKAVPKIKTSKTPTIKATKKPTITTLPTLSKDSTPKKIEKKTYHIVIAGTFSNAENAQILSRSLIKAGIPSEVKPMIRNGLEFHQIIAGRFLNATEATSRIALLKLKGVDSFSVSKVE